MSKPRPSVFPAWASCPSFDGKDEVGEAAERGTIQHSFLEEIINSWTDKNVPDHKGNLDLTEQGQVIWAAQYIQDWCVNISHPVESEVKMQYFEHPDDFEPLYEGTADAICSSNLFDYKSGDAHDYKFQMYGYALMMFQRDPQLENVTCHILYGRTRHAEKFMISKREAAASIAVIMAERNSAARKANPCSFCKWCAHAAVCPALNTAALAVCAGRDDYKLEEYHASKITDPAQMAKALRMARFLSAWCESVEHHAKEMMIKNGEYIPGFVASKRSGNRTIKDVSAAFTKVYGVMAAADFHACCTIKIGELEKRLGKKQFTELLEPIIGRGADSYFISEEKKDESGSQSISKDMADSVLSTPALVNSDTDF